VPPFLYTESTADVRWRPSRNAYQFNYSTFYFPNGTRYGDIMYTNAYNGTVVAFPNTLLSWGSPKAAAGDLAMAVAQQFWLPKYAVGSTTIPLNFSPAAGSVGVILDGQLLNYSSGLSSELDTGYVRVVSAAVNRLNASRKSYNYILARPLFPNMGQLSMEPVLSPNQSNVALDFNITLRPSSPVNLSTYITVSNQGLFRLLDLPGPSIHGFSGAQPSFIAHENMPLGQGTYIVKLMNFSDNSELAAGFFVVPNYNVSLLNYNLTTGTFVFRFASGGHPLNNIGYTVSLNRLYPEHGSVNQGIVAYKLPAGAPVAPGLLNFSFSMLSQNIRYALYYATTPITINPQYIDIGVVMIMVLIMVVFVKAPSTDEFYIDLPNLPEEKKVSISIKAQEFSSVFDKLNASYHWKFMPLSKPEIRSAIAANIRYNNIPVELTYTNIERILDSMVVGKMMVSADGLYAPASWVEGSKHDIEYLATFKKLRIYFVTHTSIFTDMDQSEQADMVVTLHGEKRYIVIYSKSSRFKDIPVFRGSRTYLVFLNAYALDEFRERLYQTTSPNAERLKMYVSSGYIELVDADNIGAYVS
jgi:hypothetical protein